MVDIGQMPTSCFEFGCRFWEKWDIKIYKNEKPEKKTIELF